MTVFKVAKIIAKLVFIFSIIGGAGCLISLVTLPLVENLELIQSFVGEEIEFPTAYSSCCSGFIVCVGEAIFAFFAERYFANVVKTGTPFTLEGSKECFRLGLTSIIISAAASLVAGLVIAVITSLTELTPDFDVEATFSISTGLFLLFLSLIFKHGAELNGSVGE